MVVAYLSLWRVAPAPTRFYSELLLRKSKPYGLANLSFRFIGMGGVKTSNLIQIN
jgi:hypothetical protein